MGFFTPRPPAIHPLLLRVAACVFVAGCAAGLHAQEHLRFERIGLEHGLSQNVVPAIVQDQRGFLWFGTQDGLNRYDGGEIKTFHYRPNDPESLPGSYVECLLLDHRGVLWVATINGICSTLPGMERFRRMPLEDGHKAATPYGKVFTALFEDRDHNLWVGNAGGEVFCINADRTAHLYFDLDPEVPSDRSPNIVRGFCQTAGGEVWVSLQGGGLWRYRPEAAQQWSPVAPVSDAPGGLPTAQTFRLYTDADGTTWVLTRGYGILRVTEGETPTFEAFRPPGATPDLLFNDMVTDDTHCYWVAGSEGLCHFHPEETPQWEVYAHTPGDPSGPSDNVLLSAYRDREGIFWFGTNRVGVDKLVPSVRGFRHQRHRPEDPHSLSNDQVTAFWEDRRGGFWVGTYQGLNYRAPGTERFVHYLHDADKPDSLSSDDITFIFEDHEGDIWVGTYGRGLNRLDGDGRFRRYRPGAGVDTLSHQEVSAMVRDQAGSYWVATFGGGLNLLTDKGLGHFRTYRHNPERPDSLAYDRISALAVDAADNLWVATLGAGLDCFRPDRSGFTHYRHDPADPGSLSQDILMCLCIDSRGRLWVGTDTTGLNKREGNRFVRYDNRDGLPNNVVYGILEDGAGFLWLSTNKGISRFDTQAETFFNYDVYDGLQGDEFNQGASYKAADGRLYFGGINGYSAFYPDKLVRTGLPPKVVLTQFLLDNRPVAPSREKGALLQAPLSQTDAVRLARGMSGFAVEFAALSFINPRRNAYAYKLEELDQDWIYTDAGNRRATYTHLSPGTYLLRVKGSNRDGMWSTDSADLMVTVVGPFYTSPTAFLLYALAGLALAAAYMLHARRIRRALELAVQGRTRELHDKNEDLSARYNELETLERIVKTVNREVAFDKVIAALLEHGLALFPSADASAFLLLCDDRATYRIAGVHGLTLSEVSHYRLDIDSLYRTFGQGTEQVVDGIYRADDFAALADADFMGMPVPRSLLAMTIELDGVVEGVLMLGNMQEAGAFAGSDIRRLKRFQAHAVSAVGKARVIAELAETRRELAHSAHGSGMAELAGNVVHDLGNALNGIRTSTDLLEEAVCRPDMAEHLDKLIALFQEHGDNLPAYFADPDKGRLVGLYLEKIAQRLHGRRDTLTEGIERLRTQMQQAVTVLQAQQEHAGGSKVREEVDLNVVMEQAVKAQGHILRAGHVRLVKEQRRVPRVTVEEDTLQRVLVYLLNNAWEAVCDQEAGRITCAVGTQGWTAYLEIRDNGPGLPDADNATLFRYGFTTKDAHQGFGLHYCANAVHEMGGELTLTRHEPEAETVARISFSVPKSL